MKFASFKSAVMFAAVLLAIVAMFMNFMHSRNGDGNLVIRSGDNEFQMGFSGNELDLDDLLEKLSQDPRQWNATKAVLRHTYDLYDINDTHLVDRLRKESGDSTTASAIRELLSDLKGPFQRKFHSFYDVTQTEIVTAVQDLDYNHSVAKEFRRLRDQAEGIFEERGIEVEVSFLHEKNVNDEHAILCNGSQYRGLDLLLLNPDDYQKIVKVFARSTGPCIKPPSGTVAGLEQVRIKLKAGRKLFGTIGVQNSARAILYPVRNGYTVKPFSAQHFEVAGTH